MHVNVYVHLCTNVHTYVVSVLHSKKKLCLRSLHSAKTNFNQFQFQYNFTICYN